MLPTRRFASEYLSVLLTSAAEVPQNHHCPSKTRLAPDTRRCCQYLQVPSSGYLTELLSFAAEVPAMLQLLPGTTMSTLQLILSCSPPAGS
jgi:hypothetical protein